MAGYDPFVELLDGEAFYSDRVAVTSEGVFPLVAGAVELTGQLEAAAELTGLLTTGLIQLTGQVESAGEINGLLAQLFKLTGNIEAAAEIDGTTLTVTADEFVGWGIPMGVS